MVTRPLYIFDLDGTLALNSHRQFYVENTPANWTAFFRACVDDQPNTAVIRTLATLEQAGCECWIWSGRSDEVRAETHTWLSRHVYADCEDLPVPRMRAEGDYTPDDRLKRDWLHAMTEQDRARLVAVFDDRDKVVEMWRAEGVPCFQVARGEF